MPAAWYAMAITEDGLRPDKEPLSFAFFVSNVRNVVELIFEQLSELDGITWRAMMGEYIIYYRDKIVGGIYEEMLRQG